MPKPVLDACCGSKMFWFDKDDPRVVFADVRNVDRYKLDNNRTLEVKPDVLADFRCMPFADAAFHLVVFDPPHLRWAGPASYMKAKYGQLDPTWRDDLRQGFSECFRVLKPYGVLIFKWSEHDIPLGGVLALTEEKPLFGHRAAKKAGTHWIAFIKGDGNDR
jgi:SAM-dependent methyltransferase